MATFGSLSADLNSTRDAGPERPRCPHGSAREAVLERDQGSSGDSAGSLPGSFMGRCVAGSLTKPRTSLESGEAVENLRADARWRSLTVCPAFPVRI